MSLVKIPACSPNWLLLTSSKASSKSLNLLITETGPKASSALMSLSAGTSSNSVASSIRPFRLPPHSNLAPLLTASITQPSSLLASDSDIMGPMKVSSFRGSPWTKLATFAVYFSLNSEYMEA